VIWLTGLSGSGKSTIAAILERRLFDAGALVTRLDGDNVRHGLCGDLGFSDSHRGENIRRVAEVARLFHDAGHLVLCTFISPFRADRDRARGLLPAGRFVEVFVRCDLEECKRRDPKGLYRRALAGQIPEFTGVSSPYEEPSSPELVVDTTRLGADQAAGAVLSRLRDLGILPRGLS
jgi:adenylyl-sulfate kinase